jgi:hypothetical protein
MTEWAAMTDGSSLRGNSEGDDEAKSSEAAPYNTHEQRRRAIIR